MKNAFINNSLKMIHKSCPEYNDIKLAEIKYGLESLYLTFTKLVLIIILGLVLGIIKELFLFLLFYNIIRMPSFGMHATKSWICLVASTIVFLGLPYLCNMIEIPLVWKCLIGSIGIVLMFKNAPADTHKKPIVSSVRRLTYKWLSTLCAIIYVALAIILKDQFLANALLFSLIIQCFMIAPFAYKLFHLPYDNYKTYIREHSN